MRSTIAFKAVALLFASSSLAAVTPSEFRVAARGSDDSLTKRLSGNEAPKPPPREPRPKAPKQPKMPGGSRDGATGASKSRPVIRTTLSQAQLLTTSSRSWLQPHPADRRYYRT